MTQNAKAVGDRLKERDTGDETRKKQDEVLKDIDALLKQNENPPPSGGGGGGAGDPPPPPPMESGNSGGGNSEMKPMGGMGNGNGQPMPMGGNSGGGRPKRGGGMGAGMKEPMMPPNDGGTGTGTGTKEPMMQPGAGQTPQPAKPGPGGTAMEGKPGGASPPLPNEDPFTKQVWGHLPEKLRQQASQYYREQYMPKYQEMLKRYYSTLAERDRPAKK